MVVPGLSVNLTTLFLCRLRSPKRLTSTKRKYFRQLLTTAQSISRRRSKSKRPDGVSNVGPLAIGPVAEHGSL